MTMKIHLPSLRLHSRSNSSTHSQGRPCRDYESSSTSTYTQHRGSQSQRSNQHHHHASSFLHKLDSLSLSKIRLKGKKLVKHNTLSSTDSLRGHESGEEGFTANRSRCQDPRLEGLCLSDATGPGGFARSNSASKLSVLSNSMKTMNMNLHLPSFLHLNLHNVHNLNRIRAKHKHRCRKMNKKVKRKRKTSLPHNFNFNFDNSKKTSSSPDMSNFKENCWDIDLLHDFVEVDGEKDTNCKTFSAEYLLSHLQIEEPTWWTEKGCTKKQTECLGNSLGSQALPVPKEVILEGKKADTCMLKSALETVQNLCNSSLK